MTGFSESFERNFRPEGPPWLRKIREEGMQSFLSLGLPTTDDESWRYTRLGRLAEIPFHRAKGRARIWNTVWSRDRAHRLAFVNGQFSPAHSSLLSLPPGVIAGSLGEILRDRPSLVEPYLARFSDSRKHPFVALNTAFLEEGAFVYLPKGVTLLFPIYLLFLSEGGADGGAVGNDAAVAHPRVMIVAEEGSEGTVAEIYSGEGRYLTNAVTEIVLGEHAILDHSRIQQEGDQAFHLASLDLRQGRGSRITSHVVTSGASLCRNEIRSLLAGEGAECHLNGLYLAGDDQRVDHQTTIAHARPHGQSRELYKGVLGGKAEGVFNGKILVRPEAAKTSASQTNKNLLLSREAVMNTKPSLEILNNDVKCNHGATIGHLDPAQFFYLRSRGLDVGTAGRLLTYAFAGEMIGRMRQGAVRRHLEEILSARLSGKFGGTVWVS